MNCLMPCEPLRCPQILLVADIYYMKSSPFRQAAPMQPNTFNRGATPEPDRRGQYNAVGTLETSADDLLVEQKNMYRKQTSDSLDKMMKEDYKPAIYARALQYRNERSYRKKIDNQYRDIDLLADTDELRYFGLGPYFYIEFFRRLCWLLLFMTLVQAVTIYINWKGSGLANYSVSYFTYLIKASLGNYSGSVLTPSSDGLIVVLAPAVNYLAILFFYFIWKIHYFRSIASQEEDNKDVKPEKFCIEMKGLPEDYVDQRDLEKFFSAFGPVYEVSVVRNYENKLSYFQELDQLEEEIKEEELELSLGGDDSNRKQIAKKKEEKASLEKELNDMHINPSTVSAFVHFQFQKSKVECISFFNEYYLFNSCCHGCLRSFCCCCLKTPDQKAIFRDQALLMGTDHPPTPSDINWQHFELGCCGKALRIMFAFVVIVCFLLVSTTIVGLCGIYISSHSNNCDNIDTSIYTASSASATADSTIIRCYCNANLVASFTDSTIQSTCSVYLRDIYIEQAIQYVVLITEVVTNIIFGLIVQRLVNCVRPASRAAGLFMKTTLLTVFLVINSIAVPVLIYADIFGFQPTSYVSLLTIISTDISNFLQVQSLSFYPGFTNIWYRNVSPIFTNFVIFNTLGVWGAFLFYKCCCSNTEKLQGQQGQILQKKMNSKITQFQLDVAKEASNAYLIFFMAALFCAGIPILVPLAFLNILSRYITNRSLLQSQSSQVSGLGEDFSSLSLHIFPFMLIFFPIMGEWMLVSNSSIYPSGLTVDFSFLNFLEGYFTELDKQAFLPFYLLISVIALLEWVIYNSIVRFCSCLCGICYQRKEVRYHSRPFSEYTKSINILSSYNIRNNDQMRNAVLHLEKYLVCKE